MPELPKGFEHAAVDPKWYAFWESIGAFRARPEAGGERFSMVIPPPNVTGSLHIGHALNQTLPDIIVRWKRMQGVDVLWLPGTDHAGIATQNVVEKQLAAEGRSRDDLGREAFEARVWDWVRQSHGTITGQMRKLGSSVDWSRERFTLDENLSRAVRRVFVSLFREGLVYRDKYIVNWCPRCRTAISDLEAVHRETAGKLFHIRYPRLDGEGFVIVATTRPETMLGDTAVAVHPEDDRYRRLVGERLRLPVIGRELPVVADAFVDPAFGTGAVKVTPAHDPNDFALGQRHDLPQVVVIDEDGRMTAAAGPYAGQDRFAARAALVEQLELEGWLEKVEDHRHAVGHCQRCSTIVEPLLSMQWFVRIEPLAREAIRAVEAGRIQLVPQTWEKTYFEWMHNIHDWCISRQLWWGHRIPAWYCDACGETIVAEETPERCACGGPLRQETDVLDTWFSSGLWPFSTLGWPEDTIDLRRYYPTDLLITGLDIIFFWVARMIMLGLKFAGDVPFRTVYITALVRDAHGHKMSKSKGNVVDPLEVMDRVGADAFRFTLAALASPGMDLSLSEGRLVGYRQFINKIWNVSRFVLMHLGAADRRPDLPPQARIHLSHRWILHRLNAVTGEVNAALAEYRFDTAADRIYHFCWGEYADWYIELVKPHLKAGGREREDALAVLLEVHDRVLRLLHPFVPFVTEEVWQHLPQRAGDGATAEGAHRTITLAAFPAPSGSLVDDRAAAAMALVQEVVTSIRTVRAEWGVPPSRRITAILEGPTDDGYAVLRDQAGDIRRLAGLDTLQFRGSVPPAPETAVRVVRDLRIHVPLAGIIDRDAERERVRRELAKVVKPRTSLESKLANPSFRDRADPDVVRETEAQLQNLLAQQEKYERILQELEP
jgi:valyl-tRNA synthetase